MFRQKYKSHSTEEGAFPQGAGVHSQNTDHDPNLTPDENLAQTVVPEEAGDSGEGPADATPCWCEGTCTEATPRTGRETELRPLCQVHTPARTHLCPGPTNRHPNGVIPRPPRPPGVLGRRPLRCPVFIYNSSRLNLSFENAALAVIDHDSECGAHTWVVFTPPPPPPRVPALGLRRVWGRRQWSRRCLCPASATKETARKCSCYELQVNMLTVHT